MFVLAAVADGSRAVGGGEVGQAGPGDQIGSLAGVRGDQSLVEVGRVVHGLADHPDARELGGI